MNWDRITIVPFFPRWVIVVLLGIGLASVIVQYRLIRGRLGAGRALSLSILRLLAISFLIAFALNPSLVARKEHRISPSIAILLDTSQSMGLPGRTGKASRLDEAKTVLTGGPNPLLKSLSREYEVKLYGLGESLRGINEDGLASLKAGGAKGLDRARGLL